MSTYPVDSLRTCLPLTSAAHAAAEAAYAQQPIAQQRQTYLNVLAVHAVQQYLQLLAIPTDWSGCDSHDLVMRSFINVADLAIPGYGRLECRPVLPGANTLDIPSEVHSDRIGYIAVQFDEDLETATLLGCVETVTQESVLIDDLYPIDYLLDKLGSAPLAFSPVEDVPEALLNWQEPVPLRDWLSKTLNDWVGQGWEAIDALANLISPDVRPGLAYSVRRASVATPIKRGKLLSFAKGQERVALIVGLQEAEPPETDISVEVYPTGEQGYLPQDLELMVLDENGSVVMQAQARSNRKIQIEFSGEPGEGFSIRLAMGEFSVTEAFQL